MKAATIDQSAGPFAGLPLHTLSESPEVHSAARGERFEIHDEPTAGWYVRKLRTIEQEQDAIKAATAQRLAELESDRRRMEHLYGEQLEEWARAEAARRRRKTITLPLAGASIALRTVPARVEIEDQDTAAEVAQSLGMVKTAADLTAYRKAAETALSERGELLPGCVLSAARQSVAIRRLGRDAKREDDPP